MVCLFGVSWLWPMMASAQSLSAVSSGTDLWITQRKTDGRTSILYRGAGDTPSQLRPVISLPPPAPMGIAAGQDRLWVIMAIKNRDIESHLAISSLHILPDAPRRTPNHYAKSVVETPLPLKVALRSCAAGRRQLWMLVGSKDPKVLNRIDQLRGLPNEEPSGPTDSAQPKEPKSGTDRTAADQTDTLAAAKAARPHAAVPVKIEGPEDRLVKIQGNRWLNVPLPDRWPHGCRCWLLVDDQTPRLMALVSNEKGAHLQVYRLEDNGWSFSHFLVQSTEGLQPILVESQLLVGWQSPTTSGVNIVVELIRQGTALGRLTIDPAIHPWALVPVDQQVALVAGDSTGSLYWTRMDLQGNVAGPKPMRVESHMFWMKDANFVLWTGTLTIATLSMLTYWRRSPQANMLGLPPGVVLSDYGRRIGAGMIDLAPCVVVVLIVFRIGIDDLYYKSPGRTDRWDGMIPGAMVIALYVGHCIVAEAFTAKTLGKALFGLRVTDLGGRPPQVGQILARNLMKAFDIISPPLLILPLIGPYRQRLGDMVGRTVIVMPESLHAARDNDQSGTGNDKQDSADDD